jgi:hypothetical protein
MYLLYYSYVINIKPNELFMKNINFKPVISFFLKSLNLNLLELVGIILILMLLPFTMKGQEKESSIIAKGAKLEKLAGGYKFTEGPACDAKGNVYFTDQPNNKILIWTIDGKISVFMDNTGRSNGLSFNKKGLFNYKREMICSISPKKSISDLGVFVFFGVI